VLDQGFDFGAIATDVLKHKFIFLGMATWLLLLPLGHLDAGWQRRLGPALERLHRVVYWPEAWPASISSSGSRRRA